MANEFAKSRGLHMEQKRALCECAPLMELLQDDEIFFAVRSEYCNLYYKCASMGKISFCSESTGQLPSLIVTTNAKYLKGINFKKGSNGYVEFRGDSLVEFFHRASRDAPDDISIRRQIDKHYKSNEAREKVAQQRLVQANNVNPCAEWFCTDIEYIQPGIGQKGEKEQYGRFDVIAVKKTPDKRGQYPVAIIELKVGSSAYKTAAKDVPEDIIKIEYLPGKKTPKYTLRKSFDLKTDSRSLGSGIVGHLADFYRFQHRKTDPFGNPIDRFGLLKEDICEAIYMRKELHLPVCPELSVDLEPDMLSKEPLFYFVTLCQNNDQKNSCIISIKNYINQRKTNKNSPSQLNAMKLYGAHLLEAEPDAFQNVFFLFSNTVDPDDILSSSFESLDRDKYLFQ